MTFEGRMTRTAQRPRMRRPLRSSTTSSIVSARRPPATPLSTRAHRRRGALFRALRASPASSLIFAGELPLMRRVDDSRSLPRCHDTTPTRERPPPCPADDSAAGRPPAGLFAVRSGRRARNARGLAAPGSPRVLPRGTGRQTQYCSVQYAIHSVRPPRAHAAAPGDVQRHIHAALRRDRPASALREGARPSPPWSRPRRARAQNLLRSRTRHAIIACSRRLPFTDVGV
jgi:hypothetical protein